MEKCFVIQPFDGGDFDSRYEDIFVPAIKDTGLEPYRVDRDPKVSIPIEDIESGIRGSRLCLGDITMDNPNVWFELGFAIASSKEVVLVCSEERKSKFPFDVQHRTIIRYGTGAPRNFDDLREKIKTRILAILNKADTLSVISSDSVVQKFEGLEQHEVVALATIGENVETPNGETSMYQIKRDMEHYGFTKLATTMAVRTLMGKKLIESGFNEDNFGNQYATYSLTSSGWEWMVTNKNQFVLKRPQKGNRQQEQGVPF